MCDDNWLWRSLLVKKFGEDSLVRAPSLCCFVALVDGSLLQNWCSQLDPPLPYKQIYKERSAYDLLTTASLCLTVTSHSLYSSGQTRYHLADIKTQLLEIGEHRSTWNVHYFVFAFYLGLLCLQCRRESSCAPLSVLVRCMYTLIIRHCTEVCLLGSRTACRRTSGQVPCHMETLSRARFYGTTSTWIQSAHMSIPSSF
jgi:hypothetical protein